MGKPATPPALPTGKKPKAPPLPTAKKPKTPKPAKRKFDILETGKRDYVEMLDNMDLTPDQQALWDDLKKAVPQQKLGFPKLEIVDDIKNSKGKIFSAFGQYVPESHTVKLNKRHNSQKIL